MWKETWLIFSEMDLWHFLLWAVKTKELNEEACSGVLSSSPFSLKVWPAGFGLWAARSKISEEGVKDKAHLEDEHLHVEPLTFRQGWMKQVFCSGNLWRSGPSRSSHLSCLSVFFCLFTFKQENIRFQAIENPSFFPSVFLWLQIKRI